MHNTPPRENTHIATSTLAPLPSQVQLQGWVLSTESPSSFLPRMQKYCQIIKRYSRAIQIKPKRMGAPRSCTFSGDPFLASCSGVGEQRNIQATRACQEHGLARARIGNAHRETRVERRGGGPLQGKCPGLVLLTTLPNPARWPNASPHLLLRAQAQPET